MGQKAGRLAAKTTAKAATSKPPPTSTVMHGGQRVIARPTAGGGVSAKTRVHRMGPEDLQAMAEAAAASRHGTYSRVHRLQSEALAHTCSTHEPLPRLPPPLSACSAVRRE